jgi:hypothetical protein
MKKGKKNKKAEKAPVEQLNYKKAKPTKINKPSKLYRRDQENCGTREGTAQWAAWQVIRAVFKKGRPFTRELFSKKLNMFCKELKIKIDLENKVGRVIPFYAKNGVIAKTDQRGVYVKMV